MPPEYELLFFGPRTFGFRPFDVVLLLAIIALVFWAFGDSIKSWLANRQAFAAYNPTPPPLPPSVRPSVDEVYATLTRAGVPAEDADKIVKQHWAAIRKPS